nr:MAG TPA: hypothetical protein [Caudoviricetes sp.]DAQ53809.1 MAG TPA: hypothetical protein [Caudoviricetes sp.]
MLIIKRKKTAILHICFKMSIIVVREALACEGRGFFMHFLYSNIGFILREKILLHFLHFLQCYKSMY